MDFDIPSLLSWLQSDDKELQHTSLECLCNAILFNNERDFFERLKPARFVRALLTLFSDDNITDEVLELNTRTLHYLLEYDTSNLNLIKIEHYRIFCLRLDIADLSTVDGNDLALRILKVCITAKFNCYPIFFNFFRFYYCFFLKFSASGFYNLN